MGDSDLIKYPTKFSNKIIFQSAFKSRTFCYTNIFISGSPIASPRPHYSSFVYLVRHTCVVTVIYSLHTNPCTTLVIFSYK